MPSRVRRTAVTVLIACSGLAPIARAAAAAAQAPERALTLGNMIDSLRAGAQLANLAVTDPAANTIIDNTSQMLVAAHAADLTVSELAAAISRQRPGVRAVLRVDAERYRVAALPGFRQAIIDLVAMANLHLLPQLKRANVPDARINSLLAAVIAIGNDVRANGQMANQEKLRRFEIKYGPESPRLNLAEALLNYGVQRIPGFGPFSDGSPGPLEVIAAYRTTELAVNAPTRIISAGQVGLRYYHFGDRWGTGGTLAQLLRPRQSSAGFFAISQQDAPLQHVWGQGVRSGVFLGWGTAHVAYVFGHNNRVVFGTDKQIIPYVF